MIIRGLRKILFSLPQPSWGSITIPHELDGAGELSHGLTSALAGNPQLICGSSNVAIVRMLIDPTSRKSLGFPPAPPPIKYYPEDDLA